MSSIRDFGQRFVLVIILCNLRAIAAPAIVSVVAKIKIMNYYMIVVPVTINGSGPYDLLLDTGSNNTMLDQKLADELALRRGEEAEIVKIWGSVTSTAVFADSFSIAGATVAGKDLSLFSCAEIPGLPPNTRGILGEDFLKQFDVLIDYRHEMVRFEPGLGTMAQMVRGEHLPLRLNGTMLGEPTSGRIVVIGHVGDLGGKAMFLLLDSGSRYLTLFRDDLGVGAARQVFVDPSRPKSSSITRLETRTLQSVKFGASEISNVMAIGIANKHRPDVDGLLPTSLFRSIFISHQGKFVILNPSFSKVLAQEVRSGLARAPAAPTDVAETLPQTKR